jgi:2Fe-2S iron-sulfur cluster protein
MLTRDCTGQSQVWLAAPERPESSYARRPEHRRRPDNRPLPTARSPHHGNSTDFGLESYYLSHANQPHRQRNASDARRRAGDAASVGAARSAGAHGHEVRLRHRGVRCVHGSSGRARCQISAADGKSITTIEGLAAGGTLHKVQQAWVANQVPQCGYCQSGMIMAVAGFLAQTPKPTDDEIDAAITNICRCGTFARVRTAIHQLAESEGAAS